MRTLRDNTPRRVIGAAHYQIWMRYVYGINIKFIRACDFVLHVSTTALKTQRLPSMSAGHTNDLIKSERRSRPSLEYRTCFSGFISTGTKRKITLLFGILEKSLENHIITKFSQGSIMGRCQLKLVIKGQN